MCRADACCAAHSALKFLCSAKMRRARQLRRKWSPTLTLPPRTGEGIRKWRPRHFAIFLTLGAGVTPAQGSVKPTVGFTFNKVDGGWRRAYAASFFDGILQSPSN